MHGSGPYSAFPNQLQSQGPAESPAGVRPVLPDRGGDKDCGELVFPITGGTGGICIPGRPASLYWPLRTCDMNVGLVLRAPGPHARWSTRRCRAQPATVELTYRPLGPCLMRSPGEYCRIQGGVAFGDDAARKVDLVGRPVSWNPAIPRRVPAVGFHANDHGCGWATLPAPAAR